jgi:hypothetical protein
MIAIGHLTKRYRNITAVDGWSFEGGPGRIAGFPGPNGSGNSQRPWPDHPSPAGKITILNPNGPRPDHHARL